MVEPAYVPENEAFDFKIIKAINEFEPSKNIFISPYSISVALGMTLNGAKGESQVQIQNTISSADTSISATNKTFENLNKALTSKDPQVQISIANSIWHKSGMPVKPGFLDISTKTYKADVKPILSAEAINAWVKAKTKGKIDSVVDSIDPDDRMFLINAIYFKGIWTSQFKKELTKVNEKFYREDGSTCKCALMQLKDNLPYMETPTCQVVELSYGKSAQYRMHVILPKPEHSATDILKSFNLKKWKAWTSLPISKGVLFLPRFKMEYSSNLNKVLAALGMVHPFSHEADFGNIADMDLFISAVLHKAFVEVDEKGTKAAAVTAVVMKERCAGKTFEPPPFYMRVDRPFIFTITKKEAPNNLLFIGKIVNLNAE